LNNNIIWHNRSFYFNILPDTTGTPTATLCPSNSSADVGNTCTPLTAQTYVGECDKAHARYWDLGVYGDTSAVPGSAQLNPTNSILTDASNYGSSNKTADPLLVTSYCNGTRAYPGQQFEPGQPFLPAFNLVPSITLDEAGNFVNLRYGPLTTNVPPTTTAATGTPGALFGDYRINPTSPAVDAGSSDAPNHDFFGTARPQGPANDIGAHEIKYIFTLTPTALNFGTVQWGNNPGQQSLTLTNTSSAPAAPTKITPIIPTGFGYSTTCFAANKNPIVLDPGASCVFNLQLRPVSPTVGPLSGSIAVASGTQVLTSTINGTVVAPVITLAPTGTVDFGIAFPGQTPSHNFTLINNGLPIQYPNGSQASFRVVAGSVSISGSTDFTATGCGVNTTPTILNGGGTCNITVTFTPTGTGAQSATLNFVDPTGATQTATLTGNAVPVPVTLTNPISFANVAVNGVSVPPLVATLTNISTTQSIYVGGVNGLRNSPFKIATAGTTCNANTVLAPSGTCTYAIAYNPTSIGTQTATLQVNFGVTAGRTNAFSVSTALSGTGVATSATLTAGPFNFGPMVVGQTSTAQVATFTNTGSVALIPVITTTGNFAQTNNCGASVAAASSCTINVTFKPTTLGAKNGSLTVTSPATVTPIALTGTGVNPSATLTQATNFGGVGIGLSSAIQTLTFTNTSPMALAPVVSIQGGQATDFAQTNNCPVSLGIGASCTITVTFNPTATGARFSRVFVTSSVPTLSLASPLNGTGLLVAGISPATINLSKNPATAPSTQTVTITNSSPVAIPVSGAALVLGGTNRSSFTTLRGGTCGISLAAGTTTNPTSCTVIVGLTAIALPGQTATLTVPNTTATANLNVQ